MNPVHGPTVCSLFNHVLHRLSKSKQSRGCPMKNQSLRFPRSDCCHTRLGILPELCRVCVSLFICMHAFFIQKEAHCIACGTTTF